MPNPHKVDTFRKALGENLRLARKAASMTQGDVVKQVNVNRPTWSKVERGECAVRVEILAQFCIAVGADPSSLIPIEMNGSVEGADANSMQGALRTIERGKHLIEIGTASMKRFFGPSA